MSKPENPPAFPQPPYTDPNGDFARPIPGMSLRDYFAAKIVAAMIADERARIVADDAANKEKTTRRSILAQMAYDMADAMLKAREE